MSERRNNNLMMILLVAVAGLVGFWVLMRLMRRDAFFPIVSREVADYRLKDRRQNLGVLEPEFSKLHREFAGFPENSVGVFSAENER